MMKCDKCGNIFPLSGFSKISKTAEGKNWCKECWGRFCSHPGISGPGKRIIDNSMLYCSMCGNAKNISEFYKIKAGIGYSGWCKECGSLYNKCKLYGLTVNQYQIMYKNQDGKCDICKKDLNDTKFTHIDHDHITGDVRGIICSKCNYAIGYVNDSPAHAIAVAKYLIKNNARGIDWREHEYMKHIVELQIKELEKELCQ